MVYSDMDVLGGVDTHKDTHTVAALSGTGRLLGNRAISYHSRRLSTTRQLVAQLWSRRAGVGGMSA